jgi:dienelactone hydrolase
MRFRTLGLTALSLAVVLTAFCRTSTRGQDQQPETIVVQKTYNDSPFEYRISLLSERPAYRVYRLTYPSPVVTELEQNNTVPADYYVPRNLKPGVKYPAVICLHILDGNEPLTELVCSVLASRGIPALSFKLPYYGPRGLPGNGPTALAENPKLFLGAIRQSGEDVRRTVDLLASRSEINPERIGITGISLGGITAATAAGAEPRLHRAVLLLAGGDLLKIIHHSRETRSLSAMINKLSPQEREEVEKTLLEVDPLGRAKGLRDRALDGRVLMLNAAEDEVVPRECTEKLAAALGIEDKVVWFEGLGHYTAMAELPRALRMTAEFFARDLPPEAQPPAPPADAAITPLDRLGGFARQAISIAAVEPQSGCCHLIDLEASITPPGKKPIAAKVRLVRGANERFSLKCKVPELGELALGQGEYPWLVAGGKKVLVGTKNQRADSRPLGNVDGERLVPLRAAAGAIAGFAMAPQTLRPWINVEDVPHAAEAEGRAIRVTSGQKARFKGEIIVRFRDDGRTPAEAAFAVDGVTGSVVFHGWQEDAPALDALFAPPDLPREEVEQADLHRVMSAAVNFALDRLDMPSERPAKTSSKEQKSFELLDRDPAGHGCLFRHKGKMIVTMSGTPRQMGTAQGKLVGQQARKTIERVVYAVGGGDTVHSGQWFFDRMAEIERRTLPHIPPRFIEECDALAEAVGISARDARYGNLFPERFHCSGVAVRGKASVGGQVLHARVLDYMRDIDLQAAAAVQVFMPNGKNAWLSLGYGGFIGTVTAMNEKGLAIGEIGGRGEGQWDGLPMSLLLREVMERADDVPAAVELIKKTPRTCEYYYVLSDRKGNLRALGCTPKEVTVLEPGQQHAMLPQVPDDTVLISGDNRAKMLSQRLQENYGQIDVPKLIEIIKRPVAMQSNLHNAIFAPGTLEMWAADAGRHTPACDEPYVRFNLRELIELHQQCIREIREAK